MRFKVVSPFSLGGGRDVFPGQVIELDPNAGRVKVAQGWVVPVAETPAKEPEALEAPEEKKEPSGNDAEAAKHGDPTPRRKNG